MKQNSSSFSVILIFISLSIIGASLIPLLNVQLTPTRSNSSLSVSFGWQDASAKVIEQEVTSKLEGVFNTIHGISNISSSSRKGSGSISMNFKKEMDMDAIRFEAANLIRQSYSELPEGVSYPSLSKSSTNENTSPILSYSINANESPYHIKKFTENNVLPKLTTINGVNKVDVYGAAPFEWVIEYDTKKLFQLNISVEEIQNGVRTYLQKKELGTALIQSENSTTDREISLVLAHKPKEKINWNIIPIKKIQNRIIYLSNLATVRYKEGNVNAYYRINGLNTVNMAIYAEKGVNTIDLAKTIRSTVDDLKTGLPIGFSIKMTKDTTEFVVAELQKIQKRTLFSFLILLVLIILINRSVKYLVVLFLSIVTNLLIAVIFYYALNVQLQLYSFAGITISFSIIIDNSIIMIDHLRNKGNKKAFLAILAATLTTIGALMVIFLLEESQRLNLWDFALVIAINIGVSLLVSLYYVPALLEKMKMKKKRIRFSRKRKRRVFKFTRGYVNVINWTQKPKFKWVFIVLFIFGFGLPIHLLPQELEGNTIWDKLYNNTLGTEWYNTELRPTLERFIGGSFRLFTEDVFENSYYNKPERTALRITGSMPDGCTIEQLNEAILKMENYIERFDEVSLYETRINSPKSSSVVIYFKEDYEFGSFPYTLKSKLESKAISLGGLDWSVSGVGRGFSNALGTGNKSNRIIVEGYNYDNLYGYAELLKKQLETNSNGRVKEVEITSGGWGSNAINEYFLNFDQERLAMANLSQHQLYGYLQNQVYSRNITSIINDHELQQVKLVSDKYQKFNVWDLKNTPIPINKKQYKLNQLAFIDKRKTGNTIEKNNQQYRLTVAYDFLGTQPLAKKVRERNVAELEVKLPIGYRVLEQSYGGWNKKDSKQYYYLFVVIIIIFFVCTILLESLKQPLAIISMIPLSFIGVFLTFYLFDFNFDQGGYASFILLSGISVNSALFIINDHNNLKKQYPNRNNQALYFKAFNYKIIPIILTITSTIVGLIPFVWNGQNEAFWFSFAVGSIGGLLFSFLGIFFYLPLFITKKK
ncbi:efflux RND transporter permease subunit [Aureibaculum sp. 2210JD6-5]|uniref:efflux RND transporter permease subunit n=1 Tax=Aureibaculum sp. 2210JD6-5 TaxID=3103957 RepID=UPI002AAE16CD|nr:efflux RND transporter permease subunit [Aureibaculum sp. 2210JD6-5]MDY7396710.1 efflux RND transporter permease subunit [Aureibaculum sp. 2210JD6-5]